MSIDVPLVVSANVCPLPALDVPRLTGPPAAVKATAPPVLALITGAGLPLPICMPPAVGLSVIAPLPESSPTVLPAPPATSTVSVVALCVIAPLPAATRRTLVVVEVDPVTPPSVIAPEDPPAVRSMTAPVTAPVVIEPPLVTEKVPPAPAVFNVSKPVPVLLTYTLPVPPVLAFKVLVFVKILLLAAATPILPVVLCSVTVVAVSVPVPVLRVMLPEPSAVRLIVPLGAFTLPRMSIEPPLPLPAATVTVPPEPVLEAPRIIEPEPGEVLVVRLTALAVVLPVLAVTVPVAIKLPIPIVPVPDNRATAPPDNTPPVCEIAPLPPAASDTDVAPVTLPFNIKLVFEPVATEITGAVRAVTVMGVPEPPTTLKVLPALPVILKPELTPFCCKNTEPVPPVLAVTVDWLRKTRTCPEPVPVPMLPVVLARVSPNEKFTSPFPVTSVIFPEPAAVNEPVPP